MQELLSILRELLPMYFGSIDTDGSFLSVKFLDSTAPEIYRGENIKFSYRFVPTQPRYSVLIKVTQHCHYKSTLGIRMKMRKSYEKKDWTLKKQLILKKLSNQSKKMKM